MLEIPTRQGKCLVGRNYIKKSHPPDPFFVFLLNFRYFSGLSTSVSRPTINDNRFRPPRLSREARGILDEYLADEVEFYHFCRQRLRAQLRAAQSAGIVL